MGYESYDLLDRLYRRHSPQEFGRICQALLEITLIEHMGFKGRGRAVDRPDIQVRKEGIAYLMEVKAQRGGRVSISQKDLDGVLEFAGEADVCVVAVLYFGTSPRWLMLDARRLGPGTLDKIASEIHLLEDLSGEVNGVFPRVVREHFELALRAGSSALRKQLAQP